MLWSSQSLSQLGSSMTSFALSIWVYEKTGSALQFFLIPVVNIIGGVMVDNIFESFMTRLDSMSSFYKLFGVGKGTGAAMSMFALGIIGVIVYLVFKDKIIINRTEIQ